MASDVADTVRQANRLNEAGNLHVLWDGGARTYPLPAQGTLTIGRGSTSDIVVPHPSVSRQHARLYLGRDVAVEDLESANGTLLGGRALAPHARTIVEPHAALTLGSALLVLSRPPPVRDAPTALASRLVHAKGSPLEAPIALARRVAPGSIAVLLRGETGVGKELFSELIHDESPRRAHALVRINCAALPAHLLESELFGHERGAFTGADRARPGLFEAAHGGTLFLDEVGDLPFDLQAKLLRALESGEVVRVGARTPTRVDVRVVSASNRDLAAAAADQFRRDLYFRLAGVVIEIPPLRARPGDVPLLAAHVLERFAARMDRDVPGLTPDAVAALARHDWPGNVRELKNALERGALVAHGASIAAADLGLTTVHTAATATPTLRDAVANEEAARIREALAEAGGNQTLAAERLGVSRRTLLRRLGEYGFERPRKKR